MSFYTKEELEELIKQHPDELFLVEDVYEKKGIKEDVLKISSELLDVGIDVPLDRIQKVYGSYLLCSLSNSYAAAKDTIVYFIEGGS